MGIICFIPVICFLIFGVYYFMLILSGSGGDHLPSSVVGITSDNYNTLFLMLAVSALITAPVFIYCIVVLARLKTLNAAHKVMWIIFLSVLAPIASALFWLLVVKDIRRYTPVHPDIA